MSSVDMPRKRSSISAPSGRAMHEARGPLAAMQLFHLDGIVNHQIDEVVSSHVPQGGVAVASTQVVLGINVHHLVDTQSNLARAC